MPLDHPAPPEREPITWTGDLDDDCFAVLGDLSAHCECMGDMQCFDINPDNDEITGQAYELPTWWFVVREGDREVFDVSDAGGLATSGALARAVCETIMRQHLTLRREREEKRQAALDYLALEGQMREVVAERDRYRAALKQIEVRCTRETGRISREAAREAGRIARIALLLPNR